MREKSEAERVVSQAVRDAGRRRDRLWLQVLLSAIGAVVMSVGALAAVSKRYYGEPSRYGVQSVTIEGEPAVLIGAALVALGMALWCVWIPRPRWAGTAAALCAMGAALLLQRGLYAG